MNFFQKIWDSIKHFVTRPGMTDFLKKNLDAGIARVEALIQSKGGLEAISFHNLDQEIFDDLKAFTGTNKDNWVVALKAFVVEAIKASKEGEASTTTPLAPVV